MPPANETRVPVAVIDAFQLLCAAAVIAAMVTGVPAVAVHGLFEEAITGTLYTGYGSGQVLWATVAGALLGIAQTFVIRDPVRGTPRWKYGIAVSALCVAAGLLIVHGSFSIGFVSRVPGIELQPLFGSYVGIFAGAGFAALAILRLTRFFEAQPAAPPAPAPAPNEPGAPAPTPPSGTS